MEGLTRRLAGLAVALMPLSPAGTVARVALLPPAETVVQAVEPSPEPVPADARPEAPPDVPQRTTDAR